MRSGTPAPLMSRLESPGSTGPRESHGWQRKKLWEFSTSMHCSIVGTCLSTMELRKLMAKVKAHDLKGISDLIIHEEAELALKVEKQQAQLREAIVTRDEMIRRLNDALAKAVAHESQAYPDTRSQEDSEEIMALRGLVADLQRRLSTEVRRRERAEQRHQTVRAALSEATVALRMAHDDVQRLREELDAAEAQLSTQIGGTSTGLSHLPADMKGSRILYVGGRPGQTPRIRAFIEAAQGEFLYHDGGLEERTGLLAGMVSRADAVFFPVDCTSHEASNGLKRLCRQATKPCIPLRSASLTSFIAASSRVEQTGLSVHR
jgi:hypothetical protein